ncbi:MAG: bifunctional metallophosphatase/5'-nucleotidase [Candidatus Riflebacteria bacterium]|nr:bifunctional metallophosphatase/5'-nucleotidase [Candidatus Riflebacteria bacterium]
MRTLCKTLWVVFFFLILSSTGFCATKKVVIVHHSDTHGHICSYPDFLASETDRMEVGGFASLKTFIDKVKEKEVSSDTLFLLLDSGDFFQGTPVVDETKGECMFRFMNALGYNASALGNHEYDYGQKRFSELAANASFPILCCNVFNKEDGKCPEYFKPYLMLDFQNTKVAVIGITTPEMPQLVLDGLIDGLEFRNPVPILNSLIPELREKGARIVIILSHLGILLDKTLLSSIDADLVLGGHSHRKYDQIEYLGDRKVPLIHPGADLRGASKVTLEFDDEPGKKGVTSLQYEPVLLFLASYTEDEQIKKLSDEYMFEIRKKTSEVIGTSEVDLKRGVVGGDSQAGAFVADAMREYSGADFAFANLGGVRFPINKGPITLEQIFLLQPFPNTVEIIEMTASEITHMIEQSLSVPFYKITPQEKEMVKTEMHVEAEGMIRDFGGRFGHLIPSNLIITFNPERPSGQRIISLVDGNGKQLEKDVKYKVAFNSFISSGGDGYAFLKDFKNRKYTDLIIRDLIVKKIRDLKVIKDLPKPRLINQKLIIQEPKPTE